MFEHAWLQLTSGWTDHTNYCFALILSSVVRIRRQFFSFLVVHFFRVQAASPGLKTLLLIIYLEILCVEVISTIEQFLISLFASYSTSFISFPIPSFFSILPVLFIFPTWVVTFSFSPLQPSYFLLRVISFSPRVHRLLMVLLPLVAVEAMANGILEFFDK